MQNRNLQKSEVRIRKSVLSNISDNRVCVLIVMCFLSFGICLTSCSTTASKPYNRDLVVTYAELTLLYEKEKMMNKLSDSLYQTRVKEFFRAKGYEQEKFKQVVEELSQHPEAWKMFIQDVTIAMDSLQAMEK